MGGIPIGSIMHVRDRLKEREVFKLSVYDRPFLGSIAIINFKSGVYQCMVNHNSKVDYIDYTTYSGNTIATDRNDSTDT